MIDEQLSGIDAREPRSSSEMQQQRRQTREALRRTDEQISRTTRQLDTLDAKLGGGTERRAHEVLTHLLCEQFDMEFVSARARAFCRADSLEVDMLAYSVTRSEVIVVAIRTNFDAADLAQVLTTLERFPEFFTEHADMKLAGMIAAVTISDEMVARVAAAGLLLVRLDIES